MNTALNTLAATDRNSTARSSTAPTLAARLSSIAAPLLGSVLITFTGLQLIASYALPPQAPAGMVLASAASASAGAMTGAMTGAITGAATGATSVASAR